jgi:hypothetical protein
MNYSEIRSTIASGDSLAWSHKNWNTLYDIKIQLVRIFTRSEYTHVGTAWVVGNRVLVLEAVTPKVRIYPLSKLGDFYFLPTVKNLNIVWTSEVEEYALSKVGENYSMSKAVWAFFSLLKPSKEWECVEYARNILIRAGLKNFEGRDTPTNFVEQLLKQGSTIHFIHNKVL